MKYVELERKDWKPQIYNTYDPNTLEFLGQEVSYEICKPIPENFYDLIELWQDKGIKLSNTHIYDNENNVELISCTNPNGIKGFYNPATSEFTSEEELFKSFDNNMEWSLKTKRANL